MELDELLDREGLDPHELLTWAHERAEQLLAELTAAGAAGGSDELARLLEPAGQIDLDGVPARRVAVAQDMLPAGVGTTVEIEVEADESITAPSSIAAALAEQASNEPEATELGTRGRRRVPSAPQPLSASELPPPPEHTRLADGEPEPVLETVDTGPIDLATAEAQAMIAANSTRTAEVDVDVDIDVDVDEPESESAAEASEAVAAEVAPQVAADDEPQAAAASEEPPRAAEPQAADASEEPQAAAPAEEPQAADASEEFEIDELEEIDDEELELLVDVDDSGDDAEVPPPPPPRPPPAKPAAPPPKQVDKPIDNKVDIDDLIAGLAESE